MAPKTARRAADVEVASMIGWYFRQEWSGYCDEQPGLTKAMPWVAIASLPASCPREQKKGYSEWA